MYQSVETHGEQGVPTPELLSGVGNHEGKALLLLYLSMSGGMQAGYPMYKGFKDFIGTGSSWVPSSTVPFKYCTDSLEPIGQVAKGSAPSIRGTAKAYEVTDFGRTVGVPTVGLLLDWSLEYPDISIQQVFGPTHSKGEVRAAHNRLSVLSELATSVETGLAISAVSGTDPKLWETHEYQDRMKTASSVVEVLSKHGVLLVDRVSEDNDSLHRITGPNSDNPRSTQGIFRKAINKLIETKLQDGEEFFSSEECIQFSIEYIHGENELIDPAEIRTRVGQLMNTGYLRGVRLARNTDIANLERVDLFNDGNLTRVSINPKHREAIEALVGIAMDVEDKNQSEFARGKKLANAISTDHSSKIKLIDKSYAFSAAAQKRPISETQNIIMEILSGNGPMDAESIMKEYGLRDQRPLGLSSIKIILGRLAGAGRVEVDKARHNPSLKKRRNFYSAIEDTEK